MYIYIYIIHDPQNILAAKAQFKNQSTRNPKFESLSSATTETGMKLLCETQKILATLMKLVKQSTSDPTFEGSKPPTTCTG